MALGARIQYVWPCLRYHTEKPFAVVVTRGERAKGGGGGFEKIWGRARRRNNTPGGASPPTDFDRYANFGAPSLPHIHSSLLPSPSPCRRYLALFLSRLN